MPSPQLDAALALHRGGRAAEAEAAYRACIASAEAAAQPLLAVLLLQQSRFAEAVAILQPLQQQAPNDPDLAVNLSLALRRSGRVDEALELARHACELAPGRVSAWNASGLAALAAEDSAGALAAFESGLRIEPGNSVLGLHRAQCLQRLGRSREALPAFQRLVEVQPDWLEAWRGLGNAQAALGEVASALASRARALQLVPADRELALEYAISLLQAGDAAQAANRIEALLEQDRDDAQIWSWLGRARIKSGELDAARQAFAEARSRDPQDAVIAHFHAATTGQLPVEVESDFIRRLFDGFADRFERTLVDQLAYATPRRLAEFIRERVGEGFTTVLDLGCGTGLMAVELAADGRCIDGIDLSPRMLEAARAKGLYDRLDEAEVLDFLCNSEQRWELIVAADVFVYIADLAPIFVAAFERLPAGGAFAFSIELSAGRSTELPPETGRYRHSPEQVRQQLEVCGFSEIIEQRVEIRLEQDQPVAGVLMLAQRPA